MKTTRDLARADPWRESLERSRARRGRSAGSGGGADRGRPERARPRGTPGRSQPGRGRSGGTPDRSQPGGGRSGGTWAGIASSVHAWAQRAAVAASGRPRLGPRVIAALALLAAIVAGGLARGGAQNSPAPARADAPWAAAASSSTASPRPIPRSPRGGVSSTGRCALAIATDEYVNPLANAVVKPERIDQGIDYAGSGTLAAMGSARVTQVATSSTGWPGAFIEYQLLDGADSGCDVFYAEGVIPADGLRVGETISPGQPIATIIPSYPTGIEIGWGAGKHSKTYAKVAGQWSAASDQADLATAAGRNFSALIAALGGPPGKVEG